MVAVIRDLSVSVGVMGCVQIDGSTERSNFREFSLGDTSKAPVSRRQGLWLLAEMKGFHVPYAHSQFRTASRDMWPMMCIFEGGWQHPCVPIPSNPLDRPVLPIPDGPIDLEK